MPGAPAFKVSIASPCSKDWDQMKGTAQKRFCEGCRQHVYDLSAMRSDEVRDLLEQPVPPCVRFYHRADGTVMTADCPVGRERLRRRLRQVASLIAAGLLAVVGWLRLGRQEEACEMDVGAAGPLEAAPVAATAKPPASDGPPSEDWMAARRARLPGGERGQLSMGRRFAVIQIIRGDMK